MQNNFLIKKYAQNRWSVKKRVSVLALVTALLFASFFLFKVERTFSLINERIFKKVVRIDNGHDDAVPPESDRVDILIMGLRGDGDILYGENLTDAIMLLSIDKENAKAALISIPRDLYVKIPQFNKMEKINAAYAFGEQAGGNGIAFARQVAQRVSGVHIDYTVAVNFSAFEKLIDIVEGIDVYVPEDFSEKAQWGYEFFVPRGINRMDGETALYYARSRYSSSDFDRSRRQQDILKALAEKLTGARVLSDPIMVNRILNAISGGIETDIDFVSMLSLFQYADDIKAKDIIKLVLDDSPHSPLTSGHIGSTYVIYPEAGIENYTEVRTKIKNIFNTPTVSR